MFTDGTGGPQGVLEMRSEHILSTATLGNVFSYWCYMFLPFFTVSFFAFYLFIYFFFHYWQSYFVSCLAFINSIESGIFFNQSNPLGDQWSARARGSSTSTDSGGTLVEIIWGLITLWKPSAKAAVEKLKALWWWYLQRRLEENVHDEIEKG